MVEREELVQHDAGREHIDPVIVRSTGDLLRCYVAGLADQLTGWRRIVTHLGDPKIRKLCMAVEVDHDVMWRDIVVDELERAPVLVAGPVYMVEGETDRRRELRGNGHRNSPLLALEPGDQRRGVNAIDVLHDDEMTVVGLTEIERLHDVRMTQPGNEPRFLEEPVDERGLDRKLGQ